MMNIDKFTVLFSLACLPILWLPQKMLYLPMILAVIGIIWALRYQKWAWLGWSCLIFTCYGQVLYFAKNLSNQTAYLFDDQVEIRQLLKQQEYQTALAVTSKGERIYLTAKTEPVLKPSYHYHLIGKFRPVSGRLNEGNFSRQQWLAAHKVIGTVTAKKIEQIDVKPSLSLRNHWLEQTYQQTHSLKTQGLIMALAFGERAWLSDEHWQLFQKTATAHLIAISGLHIALAMAIGFWLAKFVQRLLWRMACLSLVVHWLWLPKLCGLLFALGYCFLAGFSTPTLRALFAILVLLLCQFLRRHYTPWQYWWRIVALLLILDPFTLLSASFWLSIWAVACLIIWYRYFPLKKWHWLHYYQQHSRVARFCLPLIHLQLGLSLLFLPIQLYFFEGVSLTAFLANLVIVPFYTLIIVPCVLFSLLTYNLINSWQLVDWLMQQSLTFLQLLADSWLWLSQWQQWQLISLHLLILLLLYAFLEQKARGFWIKSGVGMLIFNFAFYLWQGRVKPQWITFDVGQGLAMLLLYQEESKIKGVIFDAGASWGIKNSRSSMAQLEILPYLRRKGIELEAVFLSHDDNDHSGGIADLLENYPLARFISTSDFTYAKRKPEACLASKTWQFGVFTLKAFQPLKTAKRAKNQDSCLLVAEVNHKRILLTGDLLSAQEMQFAAQIERVDYLQVAHHGSKSSTSESLLSHTKPNVAVISVGRWNAWKMPHDVVLKRLQKYQVKTLSTAEVGMVRLEFDEKGERIYTARNSLSPWYQ